MSCRIERITHAGDRIIDHDGLQWLCARGHAANCSERLFAPRAAFAVTEEHRSRSVNDAITVTESLFTLSDGLGRVRRSLNRFAICGEF